ncbi:hypothetical protein ARMGADRAFT_1161747 [Armillaria gallica]|uniref:Uncharacterized protein n=1 Tax=Armillaria gallica TaxID=47427 RepID=A0A2H3DSV2_ARMGA|nr:hypothetical protein ARMGADRAFT_1161747 [Armillaria gallica]
MPRNPHRLDAYANKSSSFKLQASSNFLARRFLHLTPQAQGPNNWPLLNLDDTQTWLDASICRGRHSRKRGTECGMLQSCRETGGLTVSLIHAAETFTTGFVVLLNTPPRSDVPRYQTQLPKQTATRRTTTWRQQERDTSTSLCTTSVSGFDYHHSCLSISPLHLFTRGSRTLPSPNHRSLRPSKLSAQSTLTGEVLTNSKVECGRLAAGSDRASYLPSLNSHKATPHTQVQRGSSTLVIATVIFVGGDDVHDTPAWHFSSSHPSQAIVLSLAANNDDDGDSPHPTCRPSPSVMPSLLSDN